MLQFYQEFRLFFCLSLTVFLNATSILSEGNLLVYGLTSEETFSKTMQGWLKTQGTLKRVHNNRITINRRRLPASEYHYPIELLLFFYSQGNFNSCWIECHLLHCYCCCKPYCSSEVSLMKNIPSSVEDSDEGLGLNNGAKE